VRSICLNVTGKAPVCRTRARLFASPIVPLPRSISAFGSRDAVRVALEVDVRRSTPVLGRARSRMLRIRIVLRTNRWLTRQLPLRLPALRLLARIFWN